MNLSQVHVARALAAASIAFQNDLASYATRRACGIVRSPTDTGVIHQYGREYGSKKAAGGTALKALANLRAPGSEAAEIDLSFSERAYQCRQYSYRDLVTYKEIEQADAPLAPLLDAAEAIRNRLMADLEYLFTRSIGTAADWAAANQATLTTGATGTSWTQYASANSTPLANIRTARNVVNLVNQRQANTLLLSHAAAVALADHPEIRDIVKYTQGQWLAGSGLPPELRGLNVVVADAVADTAAPGAAYSGAYILVDSTNALAMAIICYVPPAMSARSLASFILIEGRDPVTGSYGLGIRAYDEPRRQGWLVEGNLNVDLLRGVVDSTGDITGAYCYFSVNA